MGLLLAHGQEFSGWLIRRSVDMVSDEVQELFFSLWQVAHELERRGCLARVFEFERWCLSMRVCEFLCMGWRCVVEDVEDI